MTQNEDLTEQITKVLERLDNLESVCKFADHNLCLKFELGKVSTDLKRLRDDLYPKEVINDK